MGNPPPFCPHAELLLRHKTRQQSEKTATSKQGGTFGQASADQVLEQSAAQRAAVCATSTPCTRRTCAQTYKQTNRPAVHARYVLVIHCSLDCKPHGHNTARRSRRCVVCVSVCRPAF